MSPTTVEQIRDGLLKKYLEDLEKESFPKKIKTLFTVLKPTKGVADVIPDFKFKCHDFEAIDDLRHQLTHEPKFSTPIQDAPAKLTYLVNTLRLLVTLAEQKYPGN